MVSENQIIVEIIWLNFYLFTDNKNSTIDQITVTLLGDNNSTIYMTGGTSTTNMQKFCVTLLLQDIKY